METKTLVKVIVGIVLVMAAFPLLPKVLDAMKSPDPAMDAENLGRIQEAVQAYGAGTGYYPASLAALVPHYLDALPTTYDGKAFTYDPRTSAVGLPGKTASIPRESPGSGVTPMVDAFTGLSVQDELDF